MLKVGLLGAGRIGKVHARTISSHRESRLVSVSDVSDEAAQSLATQYGARVLGIDAVLADNSIDAVLIATSTDTHCDLIEQAIAAGKAVLCEKPVDLSLERALTCRKRVVASGRPVMIGFNRRFDLNFAALKEACDAGEIGKREMLSVTSFDPAPPPIDYVKVSGGLFRDMMIHDFDLANWLMGGLPETVTAAGSSLVDQEIGAAGDVDTAIVTLQYGDGSLGVIRNSRRAVYGYDQRLEILGSGGLLQVENVLENSVRKSTAEGVTGAKPTYFFLERYMSAYEREWGSFVDSVQSGSLMPVTVEDGVRALALAEAATRSRESGLPVRLDEVLD